MHAESTPFFTDANQLIGGGIPIDLGNHAVTRLVDWDADLDDDLLVGDGDGSVWIFINEPLQDGSAMFASGEKIQASGEDINAGGGYTSACYIDMTGDNLSDLVVAKADNTISLYTDTGIATTPTFGVPALLPGAEGNNWLPANAGARVDCADWNADGLVDIISGGFEGKFFVFLNVGTSASAFFDTAQPILGGRSGLQRSHRQ